MARDSIEVTLLGPGYGECALIHYGNDQWIQIDSCLDKKSGEPASLTYLNSIGQDPSKCIKHIIASHWHDDHIKGLADSLAQTEGCMFHASSALSTREFCASVVNYEYRNTIIGGSGVNEIFEVIRILDERSQTLSNAVCGKRIINIDKDVLEHKQPVEVWMLSPSDREQDNCRNQVAVGLSRELRKTRGRAVASSPNHLAVVVLILVGKQSILLGSDLEVSTNSDCGWEAITNSSSLPNVKSRIFKIPHHGSANGHFARVWEDMLEDNPISILTPFNRGKKPLPSPTDVDRILKFTNEAYVTTCNPRKKELKKRSTAVEKTIRETVGKLKVINQNTGLVTLRNSKIDNANSDWDVNLGPDAVDMANYN